MRCGEQKAFLFCGVISLRASIFLARLPAIGNVSQEQAPAFVFLAVLHHTSFETSPIACARLSTMDSNINKLWGENAMALLDILLSTDFLKVAIPSCFAILVWYLKERSKIQFERWKIKRNACLKALKLASAVLSNYSYQNVSADEISHQYISIEDARACYDELACSLADNMVLTELKKILFERVRPDAIVDLRLAIRKELKFGRKPIDDDREKAFIGRLCCEYETGSGLKLEPTTGIEPVTSSLPRKCSTDWAMWAFMNET
jgi:hypothetical protein